MFRFRSFVQELILINDWIILPDKFNTLRTQQHKIAFPFISRKKNMTLQVIDLHCLKLIKNFLKNDLLYCLHFDMVDKKLIHLFHHISCPFYITIIYTLSKWSIQEKGINYENTLISMWILHPRNLFYVIYSFPFRLRIFHAYRHFTIDRGRMQNLVLCSALTHFE